MLRRLAAGVVVAVALSSAAFATGSVLVPTPARAGSACSGWTSETIPPDSIRVLRTLGPDAGQVQTVPFRAYVETVMAAEFGPGSPTEAMRAGAIAVKQYAWYRAIHWRGRSNNAGECYDISDNGNDQWYLPLSKQAADTHIDAVAHTWMVTIRKGGKFFSTGYWAGPDAPCGSVVTGWRLMQKSAYRCAREDGMTAEEILRVFYGPDLSIIRPGANDMNGDGIGDVAAFVEGGAGGPTARLYDGATLSSAGTGATLTSDSWPTPLDASATGPRGVGDVDGDGRADLVYVRTGAGGTPEIAVARVVSGGISSAAMSADFVALPGYHMAAASDTILEPPQAWWSGRTTDGSVATMPSAMLIADFTGDGRADAALVSTDPSTGVLSIDILASTGASFEAPVRWWSGLRAMPRTAVVAGDFDGDGRMDIAFVGDAIPTVPAPTDGPAAPPAQGRVLAVEVLRGGDAETFADPAPWATLQVPAGVDATVVGGDWNRDGREDLMALWANPPAGMQATALISDGASFAPSVFRSTTTGFSFQAARFAVSDVNGDGRTDIVVLYDGRTSGTRVIPFESTGTRLSALRSTLDPAVSWGSVRPF